MGAGVTSGTTTGVSVSTTSSASAGVAVVVAVTVTVAGRGRAADFGFERGEDLAGAAVASGLGDLGLHQLDVDRLAAHTLRPAAHAHESGAGRTRPPPPSITTVGSTAISSAAARPV